MPLPSPEPAASPERLPELLVVGRLVAAQGLCGELRVLPLSDFPERFTSPGLRWLQAKGQKPVPVQLRRGRQLPGRELFVVCLEGIDGRTAAEALVGHELLVPASDRPPLEPGEFHLLDLVGLEVRLLETHAGGGDAGAVAGMIAGESIGTVCDLIHAGNDLLEVELNASANQELATAGPARGMDVAAADAGTHRRRLILIPFVEAIVPVVNLELGWIGLTPPPGLLDL
ncbi:MAG: ribosome maturation factor RimM [Cyanobium sp.]